MGPVRLNPIQRTVSWTTSCKKRPLSTNPQRFSSRTDGGGGSEEGPADPASRGKMALK